ncbi:hypothetical protein CDD83_6445 [Cordyceps sp. RAO-2017]|nr:hypothetical protein CDD83_6445 [Cordyceps sp. RAO-2017]
MFDVARHLPKGAHLHIHYNACLPPRVLLGIAAGMDRMFVTSDLPLLPDDDFTSFDRCELQFSILSPERERERPGDVFSPAYRPRETMSFARFLRDFPRDHPRADSPERWLEQKLLFDEQEAYGPLQTANG